MDINTILSILSIIVTVISIVMSLKQFNLTISGGLSCTVVVIEFVVIFLLQLQRKKFGLSIPKNNRIADYKLYKEFWKTEIIRKDLPNRKNLENGFLHLFGSEVEQYQVSLIKYICNKNNNKSKVIYAVDITTNPNLLLTRKKYHEKNKEFIDANNIIKRVLIVDEKKMKDESFAKALYKVIMENIKTGVQISLITTDYLRQDQIRDFIIYDDSAAIIEGHQATEGYSQGDSQLWFLSSQVEALKEVFKDIYEKAKSEDQCNKFIASIDKRY